MNIISKKFKIILEIIISTFLCGLGAVLINLFYGFCYNIKSNSIYEYIMMGVVAIFVYIFCLLNLFTRHKILCSFIWLCMCGILFNIFDYKLFVKSSFGSIINIIYVVFWGCIAVWQFKTFSNIFRTQNNIEKKNDR